VPGDAQTKELSIDAQSFGGYLFAGEEGVERWEGRR